MKRKPKTRRYIPLSQWEQYTQLLGKLSSGIHKNSNFFRYPSHLNCINPHPLSLTDYKKLFIALMVGHTSRARDIWFQVSCIAAVFLI